MTDNERVFEALKRKGECWHEPSGMLWICGNCKTDVGWLGSNTDEAVDVRTLNPDFSTPEDAFWILERLPEDMYVDISKSRGIYRVRMDKNRNHRFYRGQDKNLATALCQAVLAWVKEK